MKTRAEVWRDRWRRLAGREPADEVDDELEFHLEERSRELMAMGVEPTVARERALERFGDLDATRRECRQLVQRRERRMARSEYLGDLWQDLRFSLRSLRRRPGFTAVAVLTLALGIGANSAIWSVVDAVLVRPLPYHEPGRLVRVYHAKPKESVWDGKFSPPDLDDAMAGVQRLASVGSYFFQPGQSGVTLTGVGAPVRLVATFASGRFFDTLGVAAQLGRVLLPADDVEGRDRVLVLSHRVWAGRFGGDRGIVGRTLSIGGEPFTVVGVMPASFAFPAPDVDAWVPLSLIGEDDIPTLRGLRWMDVVARLAPAASVEQAKAELDRRLQALATAHPDTNEGWDRAAIEPLQASVVGDVRSVLEVLLVAVAIVLLIACANVINLLLARGTSRLQELAVRSALGAARRRLIRQLLTEGLVLALAGGALGILLSQWAVRALVTVAGARLPRAGEIHPDLRLLAFTLGVSLVAALLFGTLPALRWSRSLGATALREGGRGTGGGERDRLRATLVTVETALAVLLLVGAGLLLHSLWRLARVDPGFDPEHVLTMSVTFPEQPTPQDLSRHRDAVLARLRDVPGVLAAGGSKTEPLLKQGEPYGFAVPARPEEVITPAGGAFIVTPGYFGALGISVLRGRDYRDDDRPAEPYSFIVNAALARQVWGTVDAVGRPVLFGKARGAVVGVVGDVRTAGLGAPPPPALYVAAALAPRSTMKIFLRTEGDPAALAAAAQDAIHQVEADLPISEVAPLTAAVADTIVRPRVFATLLGVFSGVALLLAVIGLYGVVSFAVAQRTKEIAVRLALGARRSTVMRMVLARVASLCAGGLAVGLAAALLLGRFLAGQLYGVSARDPLTFLVVAVALGLASLAAGCVPALRAVRTAPAVSLRGE